jgi:methylglutaconyl-CoA hydratase
VQGATRVGERDPGDVNGIAANTTQRALGQLEVRPYTAVVPGEPPLVRRGREGPVVTLVLDSPANRNALSRRLLAELASGLAEARADPGVRVVVLTGTGTTFCSGVDLAERLRPPAGEPPATLAEVLSVLVSMPQPIVARVNGHVRAGGMGIVCACDLAVAPQDATFGFSEVRVGVAPAVIAVPALRRMARRAFERYALTGDVFDAAAAAAAGVLTAAVGTDELDAWVDAVVASLLSSAPGAVAATRGLAELAAHPWGEALDAAGELSERLFGAEEASEGMAAFLEKRRPSWVVEWPPAARG